MKTTKTRNDDETFFPEDEGSLSMTRRYGQEMHHSGNTGDEAAVHSPPAGPRRQTSRATAGSRRGRGLISPSTCLLLLLLCLARNLPRGVGARGVMQTAAMAEELAVQEELPPAVLWVVSASYKTATTSDQIPPPVNCNLICQQYSSASQCVGSASWPYTASQMLAISSSMIYTSGEPVGADKQCQSTFGLDGFIPPPNGSPYIYVGTGVCDYNGANSFSAGSCSESGLQASTFRICPCTPAPPGPPTSAPSMQHVASPNASPTGAQNSALKTPIMGNRGSVRGGVNSQTPPPPTNEAS